jgi:hypothetical protein
MVAPSAPRDARSKTPPGPEGSNGIGRCGCRGQPAGPPPFPCCAWTSQDSLFTLPSRRGFIRISRGDGTRFVAMESSALRGPRRCTSDPCGFAAPPYQGGSALERAHCHPTAIHSYSPWRRHQVRRNGKVCIARGLAELLPIAAVSPRLLLGGLTLMNRALAYEARSGKEHQV